MFRYSLTLCLDTVKHREITDGLTIMRASPISSRFKNNISRDYKWRLEEIVEHLTTLSRVYQFVETLASDDFLVLLFNFSNIQAKGTYNYSVNPLITSLQCGWLWIWNNFVSCNVVLVLDPLYRWSSYLSYLRVPKQRGDNSWILDNQDFGQPSIHTFLQWRLLAMSCLVFSLFVYMYLCSYLKRFS